MNGLDAVPVLAVLVGCVLPNARYVWWATLHAQAIAAKLQRLQAEVRERRFSISGTAATA